jgi:hypothetical protein
MNLKNKKFRDNKTGEVIKVIDSFENIAILENKEKIDARRLLNPSFFTEEIDPASFFNNQLTYNSLAEKIKNIPIENIKDENGEEIVQINADINSGFRPSTSESAVIVSSEEDERAELARKYSAQIDNTQTLTRQNEAFARLLGEDADELPKTTTIIQQPVSQEQDKVQRVEVNRGERIPTVAHENIPPTIVIDDPIISLFKKTKRTVDFSISVNIDNKIPRLDFIEMMEESYEMSIIEFLAEEFTENLLKNPRIIKNMIREKIKEMVYKKESKSKKQIPPKSEIIKESPKSEIIKESENTNPKPRGRKPKTDKNKI